MKRQLWFLEERLKDVTHDPRHTTKDRQEKLAYYVTAIAEARAKLLDPVGH